MKIESQTARVDFEEYLGDTLTFSFGYCDELGNLINLIGSSISCIFSSQTLPDTILLNATSSNGGIIVGGDPYNIVVKVSSADCTSFFSIGRFNYSLIVTDSLGNVNTLINGILTLKGRNI